MKKELVLSVTAADCEWDFFRGSGKGGQKKNKTSNCARCRHAPSGAVGEGREGRSQSHNRQIAFRKMAESPAFRSWLKLETSRRAGGRALIEDEVARQMAEKYLRIETLVDGKWSVAHTRAGEAE